MGRFDGDLGRRAVLAPNFQPASGDEVASAAVGPKGNAEGASVCKEGLWTTRGGVPERVVASCLALRWSAKARRDVRIPAPGSAAEELGSSITSPLHPQRADVKPTRSGQTGQAQTQGISFNADAECTQLVQRNQNSGSLTIGLSNCTAEMQF